MVDRLLVARLIDEPPSRTTYSPFQYLLHCYARVYDKRRDISSKYSARSALLERLSATLVEIKDLVLSYAGLAFTPGVIPGVEHPNW